MGAVQMRLSGWYAHDQGYPSDEIGFILDTHDARCG
jgi:hypothetical protein